MNIQNKKIFQVVAVVAIILVSTNAYARPDRWKADWAGEEGRGQWREHVEQMYRELGITPEQQEQLKLQRESHREALKALREKTREKREALRQALQQPDADEQKIKVIHNELKELIIQKEDMRLEGIQNVKKILNHEQFIKFHEKIEQKMKKGRERIKEKHHRIWKR